MRNDCTLSFVNRLRIYTALRFGRFDVSFALLNSPRNTDLTRPYNPNPSSILRRSQSTHRIHIAPRPRESIQHALTQGFTRQLCPSLHHLPHSHPPTTNHRHHVPQHCFKSHHELHTQSQSLHITYCCGRYDVAPLYQPAHGAVKRVSIHSEDPAPGLGI
jgi:hypothetical protein